MGRLVGWVIGAGALVALWMAITPLPVGASEEPQVDVFRVGSDAYLGVQIGDVDRDDVSRLKLTEERGALVKSVDPGSPAEKAGLKVDDVIVRYQGEAVQGANHLARLVRETPVGRKVSLEVSRSGAPQRLSAEVEEGRGHRFGLHSDGELDHRVRQDVDKAMREAERKLRLHAHELRALPEVLKLRDRAGEDPPFRFRSLLRGPQRLGIQYDEISDQLARYFKIDGERGILVTHVDEDGPAGKAGMKAGDIILSLGGKNVADGEDLREELSRTSAGQEVTVKVLREGKPVDLKVKIGGQAERRRRPGAQTT